MPSLTPEGRRKRVAELREQGVSFREIGRRLSISHELARKDARGAGLTALTPVPGGLGARGQAFWDHTVGAFELDQHEQEVLTQVCRLLDVCDLLQAKVDEDGVTTTSPSGVVKTHPALVELRQSSLAVSRMLSQLEVPSEDEQGGASGVATGWSQRASRAAHARWSRREREGA